MSYAPVFLPPDRALGRRLSVTFGRMENSCSRAGFLYALHKGSVRTHPLERGSAMHRVIELATRAAVDADEPIVPPEIVKAILNEVLADPAYRCPIEEHDFIREACFRWAETATFEQSTLIACETMFALEIGGFIMRGVIDRGDLVDHGERVRLADFKSSRVMPTQEQLARRLRDGRLAPKAYQLVLYALLVAFGRPVRVETCGNPNCAGTGRWYEYRGDPLTAVQAGSMVPVPHEDVALVECPACEGRGEVEVLQPFGVAERAQTFEVAYEFPGIPTDDGIGRREMEITRLELHEYLASLEAQLTRVGQAVETGDWPATSGTHCTECPCEPECPIPAELRDHAGSINTLDQLEEAAERWARDKERIDARWKEIKRSVEVLAPAQTLRVGTDRVIAPTVQERRVVSDRDGMWDAIERARTTGEPFVREQWEKVQVSTPLKLRALTQEELEAAAAGNDSEGSR